MDHNTPVRLEGRGRLLVATSDKPVQELMAEQVEELREAIAREREDAFVEPPGQDRESIPEGRE